MAAGCKGCSHYRPLGGNCNTKYCNYLLDTGKSRGCPSNNCIHHTKYNKEDNSMPKAISQDKIDEIRAMREQGISVEEIEKLTGVSHNSISKYTKDMKDMKIPAAAATTAGTEDDENITYEKLSDDIISSSYGNVKPSEESSTETPADEADKPDVKSYEGSPETSADERTEATVARDVPFSVIVACLTRISDLTTRLHDYEKMSESIKREISELEEFIR